MRNKVALLSCGRSWVWNGEAPPGLIAFHAIHNR